MSYHRLSWETIAAGFSTLIVMVPWHLTLALGYPEDDAWRVAGSALLVLSLAAFAGRNLQRTWTGLPPRGESFVLGRYLKEFALFAWAELLLFGGMWVALEAGLS